MADAGRLTVVQAIRRLQAHYATADAALELDALKARKGAANMNMLLVQGV